MAGMAKSTGRLTVLQVKDKREFIKHVNDSIPSREFLDSCVKARAWFSEKPKKSQENS